MSKKSKKTFEIYYRLGHGHSKYAGDIESETVNTAFEEAKIKWLYIWQDKRITEFYAYRIVKGQLHNEKYGLMRNKF
jgi:hypothetical protein